MNKTFFLFICLVLIWIYLLIMFHQLKMIAFKFFIGSVGFFFITTIFFKSLMENFFSNISFGILSFLSNLTNIFDAYQDVQSVLISTTTGVLNINLTYECSGVIEILVFISLILFYPISSYLKKVLLLFIGLISLILANVIRIMFIISMSKFFGLEVYSFVHLFFARVLFFVLSALIYYVIFTKVQIKNYKFERSTS
ncbi:MAG: exosortase family protein XrtG [Sarcina sp.]